jgi:hypothetical protein
VGTFRRRWGATKEVKRSRALKVCKRSSLTAARLERCRHKLPFGVHASQGEGIVEFRIPIRVIPLASSPQIKNDTLGFASALQVHLGVNRFGFVIRHNDCDIGLVVAPKRNHTQERCIFKISPLEDGFCLTAGISSLQAVCFVSEKIAYLLGWQPRSSILRRPFR